MITLEEVLRNIENGVHHAFYIYDETTEGTNCKWVDGCGQYPLTFEIEKPLLLELVEKSRDRYERQRKK